MIDVNNLSTGRPHLSSRRHQSGGRPPQQSHRSGTSNGTSDIPKFKPSVVDNCATCAATHDRLVILLNHLRNNGELGPMVPHAVALEQLISGLDVFIADLLLKDKEVEKARIKVNADCAKLINNQESFERRVAEMDQVYALLNKEQSRQKERKQSLDHYTQTAIPQLLNNLQSIRKENDELKT